MMRPLDNAGMSDLKLFSWQSSIAVLNLISAGPRSAVGNMSYYRSRGRLFDPILVPYLSGDWS